MISSALREVRHAFRTLPVTDPEGVVVDWNGQPVKVLQTEVSLGEQMAMG